MLTHIKKIIKKNNQFAVGAFNTYNLEITKGIVRGILGQNSPIIIQASQRAVEYTGPEAIMEIVRTVAKEEAKNIPIAIHLDHAKDFNLIKKAIRAGFLSVMFDGADLPFKENVRKTKMVVDYAHQRGVWVQGEIGRILKGKIGVSNTKERRMGMTNPDEARDFVKKTGVDTLAVAIGSVHGGYKLFSKVPNLDISLLKEINKKVKIPLVLHGGSGISKKDIKSAIKNGIKIININSELRVAFAKALRQTLKKSPKEIDPRHILNPSILAIQKVVEEKIKIFRNG